MKTIYLVIVAFSFTLLGCGGNNDSKPKQDGKGDIDLVKYLPAKEMKKNFSYAHYGSALFGGEGYQEITIEGNKINIEQHAHGLGTFNTGDIVQMRSIAYTDINITNFFEGQIIEPYTHNVTYRHIDLNERISQGKETTTSSIDYDSEVTNIGTSLKETSHECFLKDIVHSIKDSNGKIIEKDGDFLVIACSVSTKETYTIYKEHRELSDKNGKSDYFETNYLSYYKNGIGLIYDESIEKSTIKPCKKKSQCVYSDIPSGYAYHVHTIEYK